MRSLLLLLQMRPRMLTTSSTLSTPDSSSIVASTVLIAVTIIAKHSVVLTRWEVGTLDPRIPSAQSVDIRGTDTCPAPGSDQLFRRRRSCKRIREILGMKQHHLPHLCQSSKQWRRARSAMPGLLPKHLGTLQCPHDQHPKPDQATTLQQ